jgi:putative spermidine/putrescine transport system ATP-binding protein
VTKPKALLLDEPLGDLDRLLQLRMRVELRNLQRQLGLMFIHVTHNQEEALSMADRIAVMNRGRIEQVASPTDIYDNPATLFVNQFVGTTNLIPGKLVGADADGCDVQVADGMLRTAAAPGLRTGAQVLVSVRPEQWRVQDQASGAAALAGTVKMVMPLGPQVVYDVEIPGGTSVKISQSREAATAPLANGSTIRFAPVSAAACHVFHAEAS